MARHLLIVHFENVLVSQYTKVGFFKLVSTLKPLVFVIFEI